MQINSSFKPAWWLKNGHAQTLWPTLFRTIQPETVQRERIDLSDGDFVDIDWYGHNKAPVIVLLHGITGNSYSPYIQGLQQTLAESGFRSVALNFRGSSHQPNHKARAYHCGETGDLTEVLQQLQNRYKHQQFGLVGFSLGANVLLKWLGEQPQRSLSIFAAVAVSCPFRLDLCASHLDQGVSRLYRNYIIKRLKRAITDKKNHFHQFHLTSELNRLIDLGDLSGIRSFWEYDERVIARLHNFTSASAYYQESSSRQYLSRISIPTLLINAIDDPFMPTTVLPGPDELSDHVAMELSEHGGHLGFISGQQPFRPVYWLEQRIPEFLVSQLP